MSDKILIADDEPNILISLEYLMKREGYVVQVARDGQEALDVLRREKPRLVLLDVMMPRKSGIEVCQELRGDEAIKDTLVLMLTAKGRDTDVAKGLGVGADAYMTKPFATKDLVAKVRGMLARPHPHPRFGCRRMKVDRHLVQATLLAASLAAAVLLVFALGGGALAWATLTEAERTALGGVLGGLVAGQVGMALVVVVAAGMAMQPLYRRWVAAPLRLHEQALVLISTDVQRPLSAPDAAAPVQALVRALNELAAQRDQLRRDIAAEVAQASRGVAQERNRLAALMNELTQSVVVCNLDGRVLLYNNRARMQFRALSDAPALAGGAELIGLGRSIYTVFDRKLVAHALESVQQRQQRGVAHPSAQFVTTTRSGQLLRAQMAPVRGVTEGDVAAAPDRLCADAGQHHARIRRRVGARTPVAPATPKKAAARWPTCRRRWKCWTTPRWSPPCASVSWVWCATKRVPWHAASTNWRHKVLRAWPHAGRWKRCWAPTSCRRRNCASRAGQGTLQRGRMRRHAVAQARQLFAAAGPGLPGAAPERRIRHRHAATAADGGRRPARAPGPGVERPGHEHRNGDELGDGRHLHRCRNQPADRARRGAAPWRRVLV
jgi:CheY-like chemotaxis protein